MNWDPADFAMAAALIAVALVLWLVARRVFRGTWARIAAMVAILAAVALVWSELAVGLF